MPTVVIAEKPSVARDIARVLGASHKRTGCFEGNGWCVTWALGHLVHFAEPDDYGPHWKGRWSAGQLPMIPERWKLKLGSRTAEQFGIVKSLINDPGNPRLVCATDAGREGEHIFRLIYEYAGCRKPFERLWVSSLTDEALRAAFRALKPGSAYDDLARAARARAQADWLIGMNLTRAYTVHNRVLCTVGRVQTPTLALICARDAEIEAFVKTPFYELIAHLKEGFSARYTRDGETRIERKEEAERLRDEIGAAIEPHRTGTVADLEQEVLRHRPPPLYDLTTLQREANRRLGLTAARTLELAQALYETHKLISYPRTESRHIGEDMVERLPEILRGLDHPQAPAALARLAAGHRLGRAYVDQTRLTDHHAILPTGRAAPASLDGALRGLYDLVQTRFVCVFLPDQVVEETRVRLLIGGADFTARGTRVLDPGWTVADPGAGGAGAVPTRPGRSRPAAAAETGGAEAAPDGGADPAETAEAQVLPPLAVDQRVQVERLEVRERETTPPRPYTDASLLAAMKNAGRTIEDQDLKRAMQASGLGTPATRAEMIEKLIRTGYVERVRKQLRATPKGRELIAGVAVPLKSPELTAAWEQQLREVEEGRRPVGQFYEGILDLVRSLIPQVWRGPALSAGQVAAARAARDGERGRSDPGRRSARRGGSSGGGTTRAPARSGSAADGGTGARRPAASAAETGAAPAAGPVGLTCPKCGEGRIIQGRRGFGCERYRLGCDFAVLRECAGRVLTDAQIAALIRDGHTRLIRGFTDAGGAPFDARVVLDAERRPVPVRASGTANSNRE